MEDLDLIPEQLAVVVDPRLSADPLLYFHSQLIAGSFVSIFSAFGCVFVTHKSRYTQKNCPAPLVCHIAVVQ